MTYTEAKAECLDLMPNDGELFIRTVDRQLLRVRYAFYGIIILTYGHEETGPIDRGETTLIQRWSFHDWMAAITTGAMSRATEADLRAGQAAVPGPYSEGR